MKRMRAKYIAVCGLLLLTVVCAVVIVRLIPGRKAGMNPDASFRAEDPDAPPGEGRPDGSGEPAAAEESGSRENEGESVPLEEPETGETAAAEDPGEETSDGRETSGNTGQILTHNAPFWQTPGRGGADYLKKGSLVTILSEEGGWWQVSCEGKTGYVGCDYLAKTEAFDQNLYERPVIVIDAGHQAKANTGKEPIGPGASEQKMKVAGGTSGVASGMPESELTLQIALLLEEELEQRGYTVIQVRKSQEVDISNAGRSRTANDLEADVFVRLHANGEESSAANGAQTICPAEDNPYMDAGVIERSFRLAECILDSYTAATGCKREYVSRRNDMTGINWCEVPVAILEMGYMTNPTEDTHMQDPEYQGKMVSGIADGIDEYIKGGAT